MRCWLLFLFFLHLSVVMANGRTDTLSVTVYYPCGSSNISRVSGNRLSIQTFVHRLDSMKNLPGVQSYNMLLCSSTSPEGSVKRNRWLAHQRTQSLMRYLNSCSETFKNVSSSALVHINEQITNELIRQTPLSHYPQMRYAALTLYMHRELQDSLPVIQEPEGESEGKKVVKHDTLVPLIMENDTLVPFIMENDSLILSNEDSIVTERKPVFFVKTNLLYDLLTGVNASVEIPLAKKLTLEATLVYPWWNDQGRHKTFQIRYFAVTPRYYYKDTRQPYTSFFTGLTIGAGVYDLQWTRRGIQGDLWHISPVIGYTHHLSKRWKMEYSAAVGYVHTQYKKYTQIENTPYGVIKVRDYPWVSHLFRNIMPTSLNVSLTYTFDITKTQRLQYAH